MSQYSEYHRDPGQYPFLEIIRHGWKAIYSEYQEFIQDQASDKNPLLQVMSLKTDTIKAKEGNKYSVLGLRFHGQTLASFIAQHGLSWPGFDEGELTQALSALTQRYFGETMRIVDEAIAASGNRVRTVYFSVYAPGLDTKLHVNRDLHAYRGYLGLYVPQGDVAMEIAGETLKWREGEFMVLDHDYPHCPHNRTAESRVALLVDFLKPEQPLDAMLQLERQVVEARMKDNPYSYGVFGTDDMVPAEVFEKYGLAHQLEWNRSLV